MTEKRFDILLHKWLRVPYSLNVTEFTSPTHSQATLVLIHGIGSSTLMWKGVAAHMPSNVRIIAIDLLGFGGSPQPLWNDYSLISQVKALHRTIKHLKVDGKMVLAGHSLGALVAVEYAARYQSTVEQIVLISPPIYTTDDKHAARSFQVSQDERLRRIYRALIKSPRQSEFALRAIKKDTVTS